ncbi:MAG: isoaspartyl peptidase/L-asparaginase, partial [Campylobacter concisus]|nr:isoaspartyl peptidase/L-asparaginase [Campylobacter concisus]MBS5829407.1 isoaspartyl peptidase/L-asparaginase [Campylobacter concisus]
AVSCTGTGDIYMRVNAAHEVSALYKYKTSDVQKPPIKFILSVVLSSQLL